MASPSAGSSRERPVAGGTLSNAAPADTAHLDRLVEKAFTVGKSGRYALAATFFRHAADEALHLHGDTFVCTFLTLQRSNQLGMQSQLEGVLKAEKAALVTKSGRLCPAACR